jgi:hypothetical protein
MGWFTWPCTGKTWVIEGGDKGGIASNLRWMFIEEKLTNTSA